MILGIFANQILPTIDTYFGNVVSLLKLNGVDGSTDFPDIKDDGRTSGRSWVASGNAQISTEQSKFGTTSLKLDGSGDFITSTGNINIAQADFTVQCWVYPTNTPASTMTIVHFNAGSNGGLHIHRNPSGYLVVDNGLAGTTAGDVVIPLNTWSHIEVTRKGNTINGFVNGTKCLTHTAQTYTNATRCQIGRMANGGVTADWAGYIGMFSVDVVAFHTESFTPISVEPVPIGTVTHLLFSGANGSQTIKEDRRLVWKADTGTSISTAQSKFGGASAYFDGVNGLLAMPGGEFDISSESFTFECFIRVDSVDTTGVIFSNRGIASVAFPNWSVLLIDGKIRFQIANQIASTLRLDLSSVTTLAPSTWHHLAVVRQGTSAFIFLEGNLDASGTLSGSVDFSNGIGHSSIGYEPNQPSTYRFKGYIDEMRITKNVARYTTNFIPPAAPFPTTTTVSANVKSWLKFEGANNSTTFIDEVGLTWNRVGTPTISTAWSASGSSSGYFPGNGCIKTADVGGLTILDWKTDSFRIEFDLYATAKPAFAFIVTKRASTPSYPPIEISLVGGKLGVNMSSADVQYYTAMATAISLNTAYKVKVERIGTSLKMYLDNVEVISATIPATITYFADSRDSPVCIGSIGDGGYPFYGYVDNFIITKL